MLLFMSSPRIPLDSLRAPKQELLRHLDEPLSSWKTGLSVANATKVGTNVATPSARVVSIGRI